MKVMVTAGFDRSLPALAIAELLRRESFEIAGLLIVTPWRAERVTSTIKRIRWRELPALTRKLRGRGSPGPLSRFLERENIRKQSLTAWAASLQIPVRMVSDLNSGVAVSFVRSHQPDWIVYAGGGILRKPLLTSGGWRVLNAHMGPLPHIRGMNAAEWSVLLRLQPTATIHVIDEGIDTGAVIDAVPIELNGILTVDALREHAVNVGIKAIVNTLTKLRENDPAPVRAHQEVHRQCFTLSPALKELVELRLATLSSHPL